MLRLIHNSAKIWISVSGGQVFDIGHSGCPPEEPKEKEPPLSPRKMFVGIVPPIKLNDPDRMISTAYAELGNRRGDVTYKDEDGNIVLRKKIAFTTEFQTRELIRMWACQKWDQISLEKKSNHERWLKAMQEYRIAQRNWEISVADHEFFTKNNLDIFQPSITGADIVAAVKQAHLDNAKEYEGAFAPEYTGASRDIIVKPGEKSTSKRFWVDKGSDKQDFERAADYIRGLGLQLPYISVNDVKAFSPQELQDYFDRRDREKDGLAKQACERIGWSG